MHVFGDIYGIADRVREYDPQCRVFWDDEDHEYVIARHRTFASNVWDEIFRCRQLDCRVLSHLRECDTWAHPGGIDGWLRDFEAAEEAAKAKREREFEQKIYDRSRDWHRYIIRNWDEAPDLRTVWGPGTLRSA